MVWLLLFITVSLSAMDLSYMLDDIPDLFPNDLTHSSMREENNSPIDDLTKLPFTPTFRALIELSNYRNACSDKKVIKKEDNSLNESTISATDFVEQVYEMPKSEKQTIPLTKSNSSIKRTSALNSRKCFICRKVFKSGAGLACHKRVAHIVCDKCGKLFKNKAGLGGHKRIHQTKK